MAARFPHSRQHRPPFPTLTVALRAPEGAASTASFTALLDTGADITSVPIHLLEQIGAPELDEVRVRGHWGTSVNAITYLVDVVITDLTLPGIEVIGDTINPETVLGRDIINHLILLVDGPLANTEVLDKRPKTPGIRNP